MLHLAPHWHAQFQTPLGWIYTGNLNGSPDVMQYRVWMRQSQNEGPIVKCNFTTEPNRPHIPVYFYYAIGQISQHLNANPDHVFSYVGSLLALLVTVVIFATVRLFLPSPYQTWWVFIIILIGGGLGAHLKLLASFEWANDLFFLKQTLLDGVRTYPLFEDYRSHYVFSTLFDAHFLFILLLMLLVVLSLYFTVVQLTIWRALLSILLSAAITVIHGYDGALLIAITSGVFVVCWLKRCAVGQSAAVLATTAVAVGIAILWLTQLFQSSGLPPSTWRSDYILPATLLISYPIAWLLIVWGGVSYWHQATVKECFLLGWAGGLTALTLSGPFFPYTDRATMTLQIPLYLIAGRILFARRRRVGALAAIVAILVMAATPAFVCRFFWRVSTFNEDTPHVFLSSEHAQILEVIRRESHRKDIFLINKNAQDWTTNDLWLAPDFPGQLYCGHWFLTVDYKNKRSDVIRFFQSNNAHEQADFMNTHGITLLFVATDEQPGHFMRVPGLTLLNANAIGSLFRFNLATGTDTTATSDSASG